jgi:WD40 repeat protein
VAAGWPQDLGQLTSSSPIVADLEGDWDLEILIGADMQYAWHHDGTEVANGDFDARTNGPFSAAGKETSAKAFQATQAVGDMNLDELVEIANVNWTQDSLFVWDSRTRLLPGFPKWVMGDFNWASPVLADIDIDGFLEVVVWAAGGGRLFAWNHDGTEVADGDNNPATDGVLMRIFGVSFNYASPAVADLDDDIELEIVVAVNLSQDDSGGVYAVNPDGSLVEGWPVFTGETGHPSQVTSSPAIGDLDDDGDPEIVIACERDGGSIFVLHHDGTMDPDWPVLAPSVSPSSRVASPVLADIDQNGVLDVVFPGTDGQLYAWDSSGALKTGFPVAFANLTTQATESTPAIANLDQDPMLEIVFGDETGKLHCFNHDGTLVNGFPIQTGGEVRGTPVVWDTDGDGLTEIVAASNDARVYVWDMPYPFAPVESPWPCFRHDMSNTGNLDSRVLPVGITDPGPAGGASGAMPAAAALHQAVPNPFNPRTTIAFDVPGEASGARPVTLAIYDVGGRLVRQLVDGPLGTGSHRAVWDGRTDLGGAATSGIYFARLRVGDFVGSRKLVLLK